MCKSFVLKTDSPLFNDCDDIPIARYLNGDKVKKLLANPGIWFSKFDCMAMTPMRDDVTERAFRRFKQ